MCGRRELVVERIEDVMPEVERLLEGHSTAGTWTLGQILHHLDISIRRSIAPRTLRSVPGPSPELVRERDILRRLFFRKGRFPDGVEAPLRALRPPAAVDSRAGAESLREALGLLVAAVGPFADHPLLGPLSRAEWVEFHRIHCQHHLSFASPTPPGR